jgi:hypothetical protein
MFEFLKSKSFNYIFSFILGVGLVSILKPICKGEECRILRAPAFEEVKGTTYQLGDGCYKFSAKTIECPKTGVIEPFVQYTF